MRRDCVGQSHPGIAMLTPFATVLLAGVISGLTGLLAFLIVHQIWIRPIWMIAPAGSLIAAAGGAAMGWSFFYLRASLPARPWTALALFAIGMAMLLPGMGLSLLHGPLFDLATATIRKGEGTRVAMRFTLELLCTAMIVGAVAGWWLGGSARAIAATVTAAVALALGPGHNIPMFGSNQSAWKGFAIVVIIVAVSALTLVEADAAISAASPDTR
jgi:hypothetical protein